VTIVVVAPLLFGSAPAAAEVTSTPSDSDGVTALLDRVASIGASGPVFVTVVCTVTSAELPTGRGNCCCPLLALTSITERSEDLQSGSAGNSSQNLTIVESNQLI
jgi:hypothetical protein